jgi:hypothetical protein
MAEFRISSLRYNYVGSWATDTFYAIDTVVEFEGQAFVCQFAHTSGVFSTDLITIGTIDAVDFYYWEKIIAGTQYKYDWDVGQQYNPGNVVKYGGAVYVCNTYHVSSTVIDVAKFTLLVEGYKWHASWQTNHAYGVGDVVRYGGIVYQCNTTHTSDVSITYGLETDIGKWTSIYDGIDYKGDFVSSGTRYKANDVVKLNSDLYICTTHHTSIGTFETAKWSLWLPAQQFEGAWSISTKYQLDDLVSYGGNIWKSSINNNLGFDPDYNSANWTVVLPGFNVITSNWSQSYSYRVGDTVYYNGRLFRAIANNTGQNPSNNTTITKTYTATGSSGTTIKLSNNTSLAAGMFIAGGSTNFAGGQKISQLVSTDTVILDKAPDGALTDGQTIAFSGINSTYWSLLVPGAYHKNFWLTNTTYTAGDVVTWQNASYMCIAPHTSSAPTAPDLDTSHNYWTVYTLHARQNALRSQGDLFYNSTTGSDNRTSLAIGSETYQLQSVGTTPSWQRILTSPNVYYVALTGTDTPTFGVTWDQPWRTIKYACANAVAPATIFIKTGTYNEELPITVPASIALVGDELRSTVVRPSRVINTFVFSSDAATSKFTCDTTAGMYLNAPIQFILSNNNVSSTLVPFETSNIAVGTTYYVVSIDSNTEFKISTTPNGSASTLLGGSGLIQVIGGDAISNMFYVRNGSGIRNMTMSGLLGTLGTTNSLGTQRPTGGAFVSLDPGTGPADTTVWISYKSPYIQNVSSFGQGCTGLKIDGSLHNGGNKSIVANDYTHIINDGIGAWCTNTGALTELVSIFSYFGYAGYFAENGGRIRATNGNSSYGTYGVIAEGFDVNETPITAVTYNRYYGVTPTLQTVQGLSAQVLKYQFSNNGKFYNQQVLNLLKNSNNLTSTGWADDSYVTYLQNSTDPFGGLYAWQLTKTNVAANSGSIYQAINITPSGNVYTGRSGSNIIGTGNGATFTISVTAAGYVVSAITGSPVGGSGYNTGDKILISGNTVGGLLGLHDITINVDTAVSGAITVASATGTVPNTVKQKYTFSVYVKAGTASTVSLSTVFSGVSSNTTRIDYNLSALTYTTTLTGAITPLNVGIIKGNNSWNRLYFTTYDVSGLNNLCTFYVYVAGYATAVSAYNYVYGPQIEHNPYQTTPKFYLRTDTQKYSAYADFLVTGSGSGVSSVANEIRSGAVYQSRIIDPGTGDQVGGAGYKTSSNNAQGGNTSYVTLAGSETAASSTYLGLRVFLTSGTGVGQYGLISYYDDVNGYAYVAKESYDPVKITGSTSSTNELYLDSSADTNLLYTDMPVSFYPTVYSATVTSTSKATVVITSVTGGQTNTMTTTNITQLYQNMPVTFEYSGLYGGVINNFTYYITNISGNTFQVSTSIYGTPVFLVTGTGSMIMNVVSGTSYMYADSTTYMKPNMQIQFTGAALGGTSAGTIYYVNDIKDSHYFTISSGTTTTTASATTAVSNQLTVTTTAGIVSLFPIIFTGTAIGGLQLNTKYYISLIPDSSHITISNTLNQTIASATLVGANLITCTSTSGFVIGNPVKFVGITMGGLSVDTIYYVSNIPNSTQFQVATSSAILNITCTATASTTNYITSTTTSLVPLYPITFSGTGLVGSGLSTTTQYYISKIPSGSTFTVSTSILSTQMTGTTSGTNIITVLSSLNFVLNNPIIFYGETVGNIVSGTVYYISAILTPTTIKISATSGGGDLPLVTANTSSIVTVNTTGSDVTLTTQTSGTLTGKTVTTGTVATLSTATGYLNVETTGSDLTLTTGSGSMTVTTTPNKTLLVSSKGSATALFNSSYISGITAGTTYYIKTVTLGGTNTITLASTAGGSTAVSVGTSGDSMQMVVSGWDHITPGTTAATLLDTTTTYYVEPRPIYSAPSFSQTLPSFPTQGAGMTAIGYGDGYWIGVPSGIGYLVGSTDAETWSSITLPVVATWTGIAYGNGYWVLVSSGGVGNSTALYTTLPTDSWRQTTLPSQATWGSVEYGNGVFVVIDNAASSNKAAYSTNFGQSWSAASLPSSTTWTSLAFGAGTFVAIASGGTTSAYSTDGQTWVASNGLPSSTTWSSVSYGNGRFVAVSSGANAKPAYSLDGITWVQSPYVVRATSIEYGQGVFVAIRDANILAYTTEDGIVWKQRSVTGFTYTAMAFGYTAVNYGTVTGITITSSGSGYSVAPTLRFTGGGPFVTQQATATVTINPSGQVSGFSLTGAGVGYTETPTIVVTDSLSGTTAILTPVMTYTLGHDSYTGLFVTVGGNNYVTNISAGAKPKSRPTITSGIVTGFTSWEPGSGYTSAPTLTLYDTNSTQSAVTSQLIGNGSLANPIFLSRGVGYNVNTTTITTSGAGYSEDYQNSYNLILSNMTYQPSVGSDLVINGNSNIYKITSVTVLNNSTAPNVTAIIGLNPALSTALAPTNAISVVIRQKYSQVRLTGHDFLNIGYGDQYQSGYPDVPADTSLQAQNQTVEINYGRVFYTSTDQDGNFKVGSFFGVQQATGIVTLSASQFGLTGLTSLTLGGIAVGSQSVVISQISTDPTLIANSDSVIVTQKAIRTYIANRLSQGGSNVVTNQVSAGTVVLGGQNLITSTVTQGIPGSSVKMANKVSIEGAAGGVDGNESSWLYFTKHWFHR